MSVRSGLLSGIVARVSALKSFRVLFIVITENMWDGEQVRLLLQLWGDNEVQRKLTSSRTKATWRKLQRDMEEAGHSFTLEQIKHKIRYLSKSYHAAVAKKNISGGSGVNYFEWFDELNEVLGDKPLTTPQDVVDTSAAHTTSGPTPTPDSPVSAFLQQVEHENEQDRVEDEDITDAHATQFQGEDTGQRALEEDDADSFDNSLGTQVSEKGAKAAIGATTKKTVKSTKKSKKRRSLDDIFDEFYAKQDDQDRRFWEHEEKRMKMEDEWRKRDDARAEREMNILQQLLQQPSTSQTPYPATPRPLQQPLAQLQGYNWQATPSPTGHTTVTEVQKPQW